MMKTTTTTAVLAAFLTLLPGAVLAEDSQVQTFSVEQSFDEASKAKDLPLPPPIIVPIPPFNCPPSGDSFVDFGGSITKGEKGKRKVKVVINSWIEREGVEVGRFDELTLKTDDEGGGLGLRYVVACSRCEDRPCTHHVQPRLAGSKKVDGTRFSAHRLFVTE